LLTFRHRCKVARSIAGSRGPWLTDLAGVRRPPPTEALRPRTLADAQADRRSGRDDACLLEGLVLELGAVQVCVDAVGGEQLLVAAAFDYASV